MNRSSIAAGLIGLGIGLAVNALAWVYVRETARYYHAGWASGFASGTTLCGSPGESVGPSQ